MGPRNTLRNVPTQIVPPYTVTRLTETQQNNATEVQTNGKLSPTANTKKIDQHYYPERYPMYTLKEPMQNNQRIINHGWQFQLSNNNHQHLISQNHLSQAHVQQPSYSIYQNQQNNLSKLSARAISSNQYTGSHNIAQKEVSNIAYQQQKLPPIMMDLKRPQENGQMNLSQHLPHFDDSKAINKSRLTIGFNRYNTPITQIDNNQIQQTQVSTKHNETKISTPHQFTSQLSNVGNATLINSARQPLLNAYPQQSGAYCQQQHYSKPLGTVSYQQQLRDMAAQCKKITKFGALLQRQGHQIRTDPSSSNPSATQAHQPNTVNYNFTHQQVQLPYAENTLQRPYKLETTQAAGINTCYSEQRIQRSANFLTRKNLQAPLLTSFISSSEQLNHQTRAQTTKTKNTKGLFRPYALPENNEGSSKKRKREETEFELQQQGNYPKFLTLQQNCRIQCESSNVVAYPPLHLRIFDKHFYTQILYQQLHAFRHPLLEKDYRLTI